LSPDSVDRYKREGILFPIPVLTTAEVAEYRNALESVAAICGEGYRRRFDNLHLFFPWAYRLATKETVLNAVEGVLGSDLVVDATLVFYKPPYDSGYAAWHQDSVYSNWHLTPSVSAWIALTPSEPANGCMRVVPGSHHDGVREHNTVVNDPDLMNRRGEQVRMDVDESEAVDVVLRPGEMSLHHANIVHGSNANGSDGPRIGFIVRFVTSQTTNVDRELMQVRGNADCSHLRLAAPPVEEEFAIATIAWKAREPNSTASAGRG
jgi:ectoine hydroxylase-related dioxygenase (phytanoyl-CoA dioxygenase family)